MTPALSDHVAEGAVDLDLPAVFVCIHIALHMYVCFNMYAYIIIYVPGCATIQVPVQVHSI